MDKNKTRNKFKTLDLFAGIGGIRIGFENTKGFETVYANDFDEYAKITYDSNFSTTPMHLKDIREVIAEDLPEFDLLLGGFPCQPFSIAGYRKGLEDAGRGDLFFEILRILKERRPAGFLLENVKNLYSHDNGKTYQFMKEELMELGYCVKEGILNTMDYGNIPQNRERLYIVGFLNRENFDVFKFPKREPLTTSFRDVLEDEVDNRYYYNDKTLYEKLKDSVVREDTVYQWRRIYVRENKSNVCPTLTANMGTGGHNVPIIKDSKGVRKLTPTECLKLQGFPSWYKLPETMADSRKYKQIGNSVSVPVVEKIAHSMLKALSL